MFCWQSRWCSLTPSTHWNTGADQVQPTFDKCQGSSRSKHLHTQWQSASLSLMLLFDSTKDLTQTIPFMWLSFFIFRRIWWLKEENHKHVNGFFLLSLNRFLQFQQWKMHHFGTDFQNSTCGKIVHSVWFIFGAYPSNILVYIWIINLNRFECNYKWTVLK